MRRSQSSRLPPAALFIAAAAGGCGSTEQVFVPWPDSAADARTVVVHLDDEGGAEAWVELADVGVIRVPARHWAGVIPAQSTLTFAWYTEPPDGLGLTIGGLPRAEGGDRRCALARPLDVQQTILTDGTPGSWRTGIDGLPDPVAEFVIGPDCTLEDTCVRFAADVVLLSDSAAIEALAPISDDAVLVGDVRGKFWRVFADGRSEVLPGLAGLPSRALIPDGVGGFWFAGERSRVVRGPISGPFEEERVPGPTKLIASLSLDPETGRLLAVGVTTSTETAERVVLLERSADSWRQIYEQPVPELKFSHTHGRWIGGGEALVTFGGESILHYTGTTVRNQLVGFTNPLFGLQLQDVAMHPRWGAAIAGNDGRLYRAEPPFDSWIAEEANGIGISAEAVRPFGDGYLFGGADGVVSQFYPTRAPCSPEHLVASDAEEIVLTGGRAAISGGSREDEFDNSVTWLKPVE